MPCFYCRHFTETDPDKPFLHHSDPVTDVKRRHGNCTLSAAWREVNALHYCSELSPRMPSHMLDFWRRMHELGDELRDERKRRIEAERKLKAKRGTSPRSPKKPCP